MPYITPAAREKFAPALELIPALSPAELTYMVYILMHRSLPPGHRYADIAATIGGIEAAKLEFYRRFVAPYEDGKIRENGDIQPPARSA